MSGLPSVSGKEAVRAFERAGWHYVRLRKGHHQLEKIGTRYHLSVPDHKELDRGTLRSLIRTSGLTVQEFVRLLD